MKEIYNKVMAGEPLTRKELDDGLKHFTQLTQLLAKSGPGFAYATLLSNSIQGKLELFQDVGKLDDLAEDRNSDSYRDGYRTGIVWKDNYRPGGPYVMHSRGAGFNESEQFKKLCEDSQAHARRWLKGFDEGLAAKKAGHEPTPDMLVCGNADPQHVQWLPCLVGR